MEINGSGDSLWTQTYGNSLAAECGYAITPTLSGGYIIAGTTDEYGTGDKDVWLLNIDNKGERIW